MIECLLFDMDAESRLRIYEQSNFINRYNTGGLVLNNYYYLAGGTTSNPPGTSSQTTPFARIDLDTLETWEDLAPPPIDLGNGVSLIHHNGLIYAIGGRGNNGVAVRAVYTYDLANDTWAFLTTLPAVIQYDTCAVGPKPGDPVPLVYFTSGNTAMLYTLNLDTFEITSIPTPLRITFNRVVRVGNNVHIVTGYDLASGLITLDHLIYNIDTAEWTTLVDVGRVPVQEGGICTDGTNIYLYGGIVEQPEGANYQENDDGIYMSDGETNNWTLLTSTGRKVANNPLCYFNDKLMSAGGFWWQAQISYANTLTYRLTS